MLGITRKNSTDYSVKLDAHSALCLEYYTLSCSWKKNGITRRDTGGQQEGLRLQKDFDRRKRWALWPRKERTVDSQVSQKSLVIW